MLFNIGDAEMTVGELTLRGCYLGSNVSYNVKKMVENGYLVQQRSTARPPLDPCPPDRQGAGVARQPDGDAPPACRFAGPGRGRASRICEAACVTLRRLERFWIRAGDMVQRPPQYAA